jgi:hypothetical protein
VKGAKPAPGACSAWGQTQGGATQAGRACPQLSFAICTPPCSPRMEGCVTFGLEAGRTSAARPRRLRGGACATTCKQFVHTSAFSRVHTKRQVAFSSPDNLSALSACCPQRGANCTEWTSRHRRLRPASLRGAQGRGTPAAEARAPDRRNPMARSNGGVHQSYQEARLGPRATPRTLGGAHPTQGAALAGLCGSVASRSGHLHIAGRGPGRALDRLGCRSCAHSPAAPAPAPTRWAPCQDGTATRRRDADPMALVDSPRVRCRRQLASWLFREQPA